MRKEKKKEQNLSKSETATIQYGFSTLDNSKSVNLIRESKPEHEKFFI